MNLQEKIRFAHLYAILDTGYADPESWPDLTRKLITGGVGIIQIRAKNASPHEIISWAKQIHPITSEKNIPLIINDYPEVAAEAQVEGCHIGQDDMSVEQARHLMAKAPHPMIVGKSTHSIDQVKSTASEKPDYIGFGPIFPTPTKPTYTPIGLDSISQVAHHISVPFFCIGGIKIENAESLIKAGASRLVIVSGLLTAKNPETYARNIIQMLTPSSTS